jgi:Type II secretion system (T2SS), protein E, N-terminal domain
VDEDEVQRTSGDVARVQDLARRYRCDFIDLRNFQVPLDILKIVPAELMFRYNFVPVEETADGHIVAAFADPSQLMLIDEVSLLLARRIIVRVATPRQICEALGRVAKAHETDENITHIPESPPEESLGHDDTDAPVRASLKPKPQPRSGAAKAVPEQEQ